MTLGLTSSCVTRYVHVKAPDCKVPKFPADINELPEGRDGVVATGLWIREAKRYHKATQRCPNVVEVGD